MTKRLNINNYLMDVGRFLFGRNQGLLRGLLPESILWRLREKARIWLLYSGENSHQGWMVQHLRARRSKYKIRPEPGLISFVTTVWNTPVEYLHILAQSLITQANNECCEWIVLDNGSSAPATISYLTGLKNYEWIKLERVEENLGIIGGMRCCLERATGRYIVPLDSDDYLYPDCIQILTWYIKKYNYPPLLYTDEDKLLDSTPTEPYFKPSWDPVLFLNSAYIAHLGVIDRKLAFKLGAYEDNNATGSHDWDTFVRFMIAGYKPIHIPEIVYSWRMHANSTCGNIDSKSYIHSSQKTVLNRFLVAHPHSERYILDYSPLFNGSPDWWIRRSHTEPRSILSVVLSRNPASVNGASLLEATAYPKHKVKIISLESGLDQLQEVVEEESAIGGLIHFVSESVEIQGNEWPWEVLALTEIHPDTVMVGGRIYNSDNVIINAGLYLGFGGACYCPDRGRSMHDPGYFAQMWKQRSVSAVSTQFAVVDAQFLSRFLALGSHSEASVVYLGEWIGAYAIRTGNRVVYSPFLIGHADEDWDSLIKPEERTIFLDFNQDLIPDIRYLSPLLSLEKDRPYQPKEVVV